MKLLKQMTAFAVIVLSLSACQKETRQIPPPENTAKAAAEPDESGDDFGGGNKRVYTLSNQVSGNALMVYNRASNGQLTFDAAYATGGTGTGGGLGNQGAVTLSGNVLLAVNPGSNSISSFKVNGNGVHLRCTVASGGMRPVSVTCHGDIVFVLNAGGNGNISGFKLENNNTLTPIANSTRPLSSNASGAAQISFVNDGRVLVITEKATNKIITYTVNEWGVPGAMHSITSSNPTPFGFAVGSNKYIFVSEAVGGAPGASTLSSYLVKNNGSISLAAGPVGANQSAACWVVMTDNGKYAYATNTASNNLTSFNVNVNNGNLSVNTAVAATSGTGPIDAALSNNSKYLYVLNAGSNSFSVYDIANNGGLTAIQTVTGLPAGATGLAAK